MTLRAYLKLTYDAWLNMGTANAVLYPIGRVIKAVRWMTDEEDVWTIPNHLCEIPHRALLDASTVPRLTRVDDRLYAAGLVGMSK